MKKIIATVLIILMGAGCVFSAENTKYSRKFIKNFQDCDKYSETVTVERDGKTYTETRSLSGWKNGMCHYQEKVSSKDGNTEFNCLFSELQLDELYTAMKSKFGKTERYNIDVFTEKKNPKTGKVTYVPAGTTIVKGSKAYVTWEKYKANPYFCVAK